MMEVFYETLQIMGISMLGIFSSITLFYVLIKILIKVFPQKQDEEYKPE
ncbi:MAG: hypothetical protein ACPLRZ_00035 [Thermovenabulum sp.]